MKYKFIIIIGLGLTLSSCKKFLEEIPTGSLTSESKITSAQSGQALALGPYRSLGSWVAGGTEYSTNLAASLEYFAGKSITYYSQSGLWLYESDVIAGDNGYFRLQWTNWYRGVMDCNLSISLIPNVTGISDDQKSIYLGELRTLRAFYYFCLVRYYGDVVPNTSVITDVSIAEQPRSSLKTIYDKIIVPDLEFAVNESKLADAKSTTGTITKYAARTMLADVYLTMAGYPYQEVATDTTKKWCLDGLWAMTDYPVNTASAKELLQKAKTQLDFLYGKYSLGIYDDFHNPSMNNKGEAIFQAQFLAGTSNFGLIPFALPSKMLNSVYTDELGTFVPSPEYIASYNPADLRVQDRQFFFYSDTKAPKWDPNESPCAAFPQGFLYKWYDKSAIKSTMTSSLNWTFYRYSEVLLMLTEVNWALNQLGVVVPQTDILKGINAIRTRALLPIYESADINLFNIMSERAYELVFESKMLFDMRRTRKALVDGSGKFTNITNFVGHQPTRFSYQFSAKHLLSPISSTEISNNRFCLQNFGYTPKQTGQ